MRSDEAVPTMEDADVHHVPHRHRRDEQPGPVATINARQISVFRAHLREQSERLGMALLDPDSDEERVLALNFEARIRTLAITSTVRVFDYDEAVYRHGRRGPVQGPARPLRPDRGVTRSEVLANG